MKLSPRIVARPEGPRAAPRGVGVTGGEGRWRRQARRSNPSLIELNEWIWSQALLITSQTIPE